MAKTAEKVRAAPAPQRTQTTTPVPAFQPQVSATYWSRHMDTSTVGGRMTIRREELGLKQEEVAVRMGVARTAYSQYETRIVTPTLAKLENAAQALETTPEWLAFGIGERHSMPEVAWDVPSKTWVQVNSCALNPTWMKQHLKGVDLKALCTILIPEGSPSMNADDIAIVVRDAKVTDTAEEFVYMLGASVAAGMLKKTKEGVEVSMGKASETVHARNIKVLGRVVGSISLG